MQEVCRDKGGQVSEPKASGTSLRYLTERDAAREELTLTRKERDEFQADVKYLEALLRALSREHSDLRDALRDLLL